MSRELVQSALQLLATILGDAGVKATVVFAVALIICPFLRRASAAVKHRIWSLTFSVALVLPLGSAFIPQWRIPLLPAVEAPSRGVVPTGNVSSSGTVHPPIDDSPVTQAGSQTARYSVDRSAAGTTAGDVEPTIATTRPMTSAPLRAMEMPVEPSSLSDGEPSKSLSITNLTTPLVFLWSTGFLFVIAPLMIGVAWLQRLLSAATRLTDTDAADLVSDQAAKLGLLRRIVVVETDASLVPMTTGVLRPFVVLPFDWRQWTKSRLQFVLLHELAHIHRLDVLFQSIARMACAVYWFNPLAWFALHRLRIEREFACDDCVVSVADQASAYANELLNIAQSYRESRLAVGIAMTRGSALEQRILSMFDENRSHRPVSKSMAALLGTVTLLVAIALLFVTLGESVAVSSEPLAAAEEQPAPELKTAQQSTGEKSSDSVESKPDQASANQTATDKKDAKSKAKKKDLTRVFVGGPDRAPVDKAEIYWIRSRVHDLRPMKAQLVATTDASGYANFEAPWKIPADKNQPASWEYSDRVVVKAKGFGWEYTSPESMSRPSNGPGAVLSALFGSAGNAIGLPAAGPSIRGQIFDIEGQPVSGATIRVRWFDSNGIDDVTHPRFFERAQGVRDVIEPEQLRHLLSSATTDSKGRFEIVDLPKNCLVDLLIQGDAIESTGLIAFNGSENDIDVPQGARRDQKEFKIHGRNLRMVVGPSKSLEGQVLDLDTGSPIADAVVRAFSIHGINLYSSREREEFSTRTDESGHYRITGLPLGDENRLVAFTTGDVPYIPIGHEVNTNGPEPVTRQEFRLKKGVWAEGRVCDAESNAPFTGEIVYYSFINQEIEKSIPGFRDAYVDGRYWTNANGEFRVPVAPIRGILAFRYDGHYQAADPMTRYPRGYGSESIGGAEKEGGLGSYPTRPFYLIPSNYHRLAEVHPTEGQATVQVDMSLRASKPVTIAVVDPAGKPVVGYEAYGAAENWGWQKKDTSKFDVGDLKPGEQRKIFVFHRQRNLAGGTTVTSPTEGVVTIQLDKAGSISGQFFDEDGEPIKGGTVNIDYEGLLAKKDTAIWADGPKLIYNPTTIPTDDEGHFVVDGLIPGWKYSAYVSAKRTVGGNTEDRFLGRPFQDTTIEPGENKDLGKIKLAPQN